MAKVSISVLERNDEPGIHPLFDHETSEVIGEVRHGKMTLYKKSPTPIIDSLTATSSGVKYDSPENARPCPKNFKSIGNGKACLQEFSKTPYIDSLMNSADFPLAASVPGIRPLEGSRLTRDKSLTVLLGGA